MTPSTILVILTMPTVQCVRPSPSLVSCGERCWFPHLRNGSSGRAARWWGNPRQERKMPELAISADKVVFLIEKTREFDVKEDNSDPDTGSNSADDNMVDVLRDNGGDPV